MYKKYVACFLFRIINLQNGGGVKFVNIAENFATLSPGH